MPWQHRLSPCQLGLISVCVRQQCVYERSVLGHGPPSVGALGPPQLWGLRWLRCPARASCCSASPWAWAPPAGPAVSDPAGTPHIPFFTSGYMNNYRCIQGPALLDPAGAPTIPFLHICYLAIQIDACLISGYKFTISIASACTMTWP